MSEFGIQFVYETKDITRNVLETRTLLRTFNNLRLSIQDVQEVIKKPTPANVFWMLVQLMRTYNTLRRLYRMMSREMNDFASLTDWINKIQPVDEDMGAESIIPMTGDIGFGPMTMDIQAFRDNIPIELERIDVSMLPEQARERLQQIFEEEAEMTVIDARAFLRERIIYPEFSTGNLENSIQWQPTSNGVRIFADAYYAWWVERGQRSFMGHWFMGDAAEQARQRLPLRIQEELGRLLRGEG